MTPPLRTCVAVSDNTWYVMKLCSTFVSRNRFLTSGKQSTHPTWPHGIYCILTGVGVEWTNRKFLPNSTIVKKCLDYSFWLMVGAKAPVRLTLKMLCKCTWTSKNIEGNSDHKHRCQSMACTETNCNTDHSCQNRVYFFWETLYETFCLETCKLKVLRKFCSSAS